MTKPLITVVLILPDEAKDPAGAIASVFAQTYRPLELIIVEADAAAGAAAKVPALTAAPPAGVHVRVIASASGPRSALFNAGATAAAGDYISLLTADDAYEPERLEGCAAAAQGGSVVVTYIAPVGANGRPLPISNRWRAAYDRRLLHHIAAFPNVSCLAFFMDVVATPGNLFIPRDVFVTVGQFASFENLFYLDFFLRAALQREPALIREKLLVHRPPAENDDAPHLDEHAAVIREHILTLWSGRQPPNALADVFTAHPFLLAHTDWPRALNKAFDGLLEYRKPAATGSVDGALPAVGRPSDSPPAFTIVTHELSLTGAPVIVLELASLLRARGCAIKVLSLIDGPLKPEFKRRAIPIVTPPLLLDRLSRLQQRTMRWAMRGRRLPERALNWFAGLLRVLAERAWQSQLWFHATGTLVLNSVACWPLAARLPSAWRKPAFWYVHETLDPHWLMPAEHENKRLRKLVAAGRLKILFGSDATSRHWAGNQYDGLVRYWSGISKSTDYLGPASSRRQSNEPPARRVILNVGTIGGRKGTRALIEAFALGRADGSIPADAELCIVGTPRPSKNPEARDIVRRVYQPDLRGHVRLVYNVAPSVLRSYYDEADVYAHASIFDCMPLAVLTAMAHGLPIVTTDVDGCKEAIVHESCGLLVQPGELRQMAQALSRLLNQPAQARAFGEAARARFIERFSAEATFPPLYDALVAPGAAA